MLQPSPERSISKTLQRLDIFISSPGDVQAERQIAVRVIDRINQLQAIAERYVLRPLAYEDLVPAAVGQQPQTTVDRYMIAAGEADLFICILCHRMGTPVLDEQTGEQFQSGTEYEFIKAYRANQKFGEPYILLYRGEKPLATDADQEQFARVQSFFERFVGPDAEFRGLYKTYTSVDEFEDMLFKDIDQVIWKNVLSPGADAQGLTPTQDLIHRNLYREELADAPRVEQFYGRERERADVKRWIVDDDCRLVAVLGIGGVGKTALVATVVEQIRNEFDYSYWRSLQHRDSLEYILQDAIKFFSAQQRIDLPDDLNGQISLLMEYLQAHRCLVVLDNFESVLRRGDRVGQYREGYEGYGRLLQRIGEGKHRSCLLLTSREKPQEVAALEGAASGVRTLQLSGLEHAAGKAILQDKGLSGTDEASARLIDLYSGNPLALKLVSEPIRALFDRDIARFLAEGDVIVGEVRDLLDQQFGRLPAIEQGILYWLAIEREVVALRDLRDNMAPTVSKGALLAGLESLERRSMIESAGPARFTLQPVIMEYATAAFVEQVHQELSSEAPAILASHALIKAQAKNYVRKTQERLLLAPVANRLLATLGREGSERKLQGLLALLHGRNPQASGYAAGNILNLLVYLACDLRGYDFSHLPVWQAYLQDVMLPDVDFAHADLATSVFTESFEGIITIAFSPYEARLATGTSTGEIWIWKAPEGTPLQILRGHTNQINSVAFSPDGKLLASASEDQTVRLWDAGTGECMRVLRGHASLSLAFSPDGTLLASGGEDHDIQFWEVGTGASLDRLQGHSGWIKTIAFSPDGTFLASGSQDHSVRVWEISTRECRHVLQGHAQGIASVTFNPKGTMLASGSVDQIVRFWDAASGRPLAVLPEDANRIGPVVFSPDGDVFASCNDGHTIRLWATETGDCIATLQSDGFQVNPFAFSFDGSILASSGADQSLQFWEVSTGQSLKALQGYSNWMKNVTFDPSGELLASSGDDQMIRLWEIGSRTCLRSLQGHDGHIRSIAFSPDGALLASGGDDQTIRLWNAGTGEPHAVLRGHIDGVWAVAFSPDNKLLASGSFDQTIRLWEIGSRTCLRSLQGHAGYIRSVAFSPDGTLLASGGDDQTIRLWNAGTGEPRAVLRGHTDRVWAVAFSPDGQLLASGSGDQTIRLWAVATGQAHTVLRGHTDQVWAVAFSPDGTLLASGSGDQTIRLWTIDSGRFRDILQGLADRVRSVASKPRALSADQSRGILRGHSGWVRSVAFSPDGRVLASCSHDGTIRLWDGQKAEYLTTLRSDRPYERMNITGARGLTEPQKTSLIALGAIAGQASEIR